MYMVLALLLFGLLFLFKPSRKDRKPPGPYRWPLIGNVLEMPTIRQWEKFSEWAIIYGDMTYLEILGKPICVINSVELANRLLDKKSAIYSDRPHFVMAGDLCEFKKFFPLTPYGEEWREQRKLVASALAKSNVPRYYPLQEREARKLVLRLVNHPEELFSEVKLMIGRIIMQVIYGYTPTSASDPILALPIQSVIDFGDVTEAGAWLVDFLPFLQHLPKWMPGTGFLKTAERIAKDTDIAARAPYNWCKDNLASGKCIQPNVCSDIFSAGSLSLQDESRLVHAAGSVLGGGLDTCMSLTLSLLKLITMYPEVQDKAQEELDRVIGVGEECRLPTIKDKDNLPYLRGVITEVIRLCPPIPLSLPHALTQDDVLEGGEYLPKQTIVLPNVWYMLRNPEAYPEPDRFNPDRYAGSHIEMERVWNLAFGFGRRSCPGVDFAEGTLFAFASTILATCRILPMKDNDGKMLSRDSGLQTTSGNIVFPENFACKLEYRNEKVREMLEEDE